MPRRTPAKPRFKDPRTIQFEVTEGCDRMCSFCGIQSLWAKKEDRIIRTMTLGTAERLIASLLDWLGPKVSKQVCFQSHGEPTLNKDLPAILAMVREALPLCQLMVATNGSLLRKKGGPQKTMDLFAAGLNVLVVDVYDKEAELAAAVAQCGIPTFDYYGEDCPNPYWNMGPKKQKIVVMGDLGSLNKVRPARRLDNMAGNVPPAALKACGVTIPPLPLKKTCAVPFRELIINQDGTVSGCCQDWRHENIMGDIAEQSLQEIWNCDAMFAMRQLLQEKRRIMRPCYLCSSGGGFRLGLLPKVDFAADFGQDPIEVLDKHLASTEHRAYPSMRPARIVTPPKDGFLF